ncbi:hypothetical protein J6590_043096 [Homalodisca vitripennis]|nr:hypothetical protein J6590_043096 [Homalodisca vitripennis]
METRAIHLFLRSSGNSGLKSTSRILTPIDHTEAVREAEEHFQGNYLRAVKKNVMNLDRKFTDICYKSNETGLHTTIPREIAVTRLETVSTTAKCNDGRFTMRRNPRLAGEHEVLAVNMTEAGRERLWPQRYRSGVLPSRS